MTNEPRPDMIDGLLKACWLLECGRAEVYATWGEGYQDHLQRTRRRAEIAADVLMSRSVPPPIGLVAGHATWLSSLAGTRPDAVPLGPAAVQRLAEWTNVYLVPYLPSDPQEFVALGETELHIPVPPRRVDDQEVFLPPADLPDGTRFAILTDVHIGADHAEELARAAVADINQLDPAFVVVSGDITDDGEPEQFQLAKSILDEVQAPLYIVLGNHDAVRRSTRAPEGETLFTQIFGSHPSDQLVVCDGVQIAVLDTTDPTPWPFPDWDLHSAGFRQDAAGTAGGALRAWQPDSIAAELDPDHPSLLIGHHELQPFVAFPPVQFALREEDSERLLGALSGHHLLGMIAGHTHRSALTQVGAGWPVPQLEIPSLKDWPFAYTVGSVQQARVHVAVQQLTDRRLVGDLGQRLTPIYRNYVTGPDAALTHVFGA